MRAKLTTRRVLTILGLALVAGTAMFCSPGFLIRAGIEEAKILSRRQPIQDLLLAPATPERTREKLAVVTAARSFAERELGLDVGRSYTAYSEVDRDTLLLVVSGSRKDGFRPVTWWFPIVGRVPYKGFFNPDRALREARRLETRGYDVHVRPAGAFSTLGWFNDPLLSTILGYGDVPLAGTVIHEVTHNTIYLPGQAAFNESFANFVGERGAIELFCGIEGDDGPRCRRARDSWADRLVFGAALSRLVADLEGVYARGDLSFDQKVAAREVVIDEWRASYERDVVPRLNAAFRAFHQSPINNATLIGIRLYYDRLELFDAAHEALGGELRRTIERIVAAAEASPRVPFEALARLADRVAEP